MSDEPLKVELATPDLAAANRRAFAELFPGVLDDGVLDVGRLSELLGAKVTEVPDGGERYGLQFAGKREAVRPWCPTRRIPSTSIPRRTFSSRATTSRSSNSCRSRIATGSN